MLSSSKAGAQSMLAWAPKKEWQLLVKQPVNPPEILTLVISQIQLRYSALPKGKSIVCLDSLLLYVYMSVFILFKELVHNQS